ncbi:hypothetical protein [Nocardia salmonicida]|uniref:hypothetical protein n=1 Tax=Nocardia salmonicida TaxID=53431 RepID=UPI00378D0B2E
MLQLEEGQEPHVGVAEIVTPVGTVVFTTRLGQTVAGGRTSAWQLPSGATVYRWNKQNATVDLIVGRILRRRHYVDRAVTARWAGVWQIHATATTPELELRAQITGMPADADVAPDCGEHLDALTVDSPATTLSMGGPDLDLLYAHSRIGRHLPQRWTQHLAPTWARNTTPFSVGISNPGQLTWRLPGLEAGESLGLCAAIAWRPTTGDVDNVDTWLLVDYPIDDALEQLLAP